MTEEEIEEATSFLKEMEIEGYKWTALGREKYIVENVIRRIKNFNIEVTLKDTEINKLNNVIDRMAEVLSDFDFDKQCEDCRCDYCNAVEDTDEYMKCIKEYFMKEDK